MRVRRLRDGFIQLLYGKAVFFRNFGDQETENPISGGLDRPNEIIHFKKYTPMNNYYGIPDIVAAQNAMAGNEFAGKYNLDYFENKAVPRYIITVKGAKLSPDSERKLLEFFQVGLKGKNHRSLYVPLPADSPDNKVEFKMEPVEAGVQDSSFNTYRRSNRDEILLSHRVPINKIGTPEGINLAAARDADKTFREQVCRPAQDILEKKLNKMISEMTDALTLKFNELTLTDEDTQSKIDERYLRMQVITPNEVRIRKGMVPIDGGDNVVELKPQQQSEIRTQANGNRLRDQNRQSNSPDLSGEGRNAQGDGRQVD
jgi:HK97 family phage portal protein